MTQRVRTGVLVSGGGTNLQALIDAAADPGFPAEIAVVISNKPNVRALERAEAAGISTQVIDHRAFESRAAFDAAVDAGLRDAGCEILCLAGFMRIFTAEFVEGWAGQILNIHPSLLPAFPGVRVHEQALAAGVRISGCTVHLVTPELDAGPILVQAAVPVLPDDTPASLAARVLGQEHRIYPLGLRLLAEGRIDTAEGRATIKGTPDPTGDPLVNPGLG